MALPTEIAGSIGEFLDICTQHDPDHQRMWFRGQSDASWPLLPGMLRSRTFANHPVPTSPAPVVIEDSMRNQFMNRAAQYDVGRAKTVLEELALMQHHGLPTRLLDWSEAALIGLYWAIQSKSPSDAMVFALVPERVCGRVSTGLEPGGDHGMRVSLNLGIDLSSTLYWLPRYVTKRLEAQRGAFTVHKLVDWAPLEDEADPRDALLRILIPGDAKASMCEQLNLAGVNHLNLFPDLDGVATYLKGSFFDGFKPHHWQTAASGGGEETRKP